MQPAEAVDGQLQAVAPCVRLASGGQPRVDGLPKGVFAPLGIAQAALGGGSIQRFSAVAAVLLLFFVGAQRGDGAGGGNALAAGAHPAQLVGKVVKVASI